MKRFFLLFIAFITFVLWALPRLFQESPQTPLPKTNPAIENRADTEQFHNAIRSHFQNGSQNGQKIDNDYIFQEHKKYKDKKIERSKTFVESCKPDVQKFCKATPCGNGRLNACLKSHESELSESCKNYLSKNIISM